MDIGKRQRLDYRAIAHFAFVEPSTGNSMVIDVRLMKLEESHLVVDYFHGASPEHLELLGVDPTRLPSPSAWQERLQSELARPLENRSYLLTIWLEDRQPVGFSTADKIAFGKHAYMHLHVTDPGRRGQGLGVACVKQSAAIYFDVLGIKQLYCEPNALNVAPNRALQRAGFKYLKTHMTVPGPLNYHQAVTRWVYER